MNEAEGKPVTTVTIAGPDLRRFLDGLPGVDSVGAEARAAVLASRSIKTTAKRLALDLAISMIDLTTLEGQDTPGKVRAMCAKAKHPDPTDGRGGLRLSGSGSRRRGRTEGHRHPRGQRRHGLSQRPSQP
jgi:hypothetical protein